MSAFIWVVLTFTVIEIFCKLVLLATDSWRRPSRLTAISFLVEAMVSAAGLSS